MLRTAQRGWRVPRFVPHLGVLARLLMASSDLRASEEDADNRMRVRVCRCRPRSSKPSTGRSTFRGGFDSHALSPRDVSAEQL